MIWQSNSEKETFAVAEEIARQASPGVFIYWREFRWLQDCIWPKDLPMDWESRSRVTMPDLYHCQEYHEGRLPLYHFDVYRIADVEEMYELDCEGYFYGDGVCLIEWASQIRDILPDDCHQVTIAKDLKKGFVFER